MNEILLFVEDALQEQFIKKLISRCASDSGIANLKIRLRSSTGGKPAVLSALSKYSRNCKEEREILREFCVVAIDANCHGYNAKRSEITKKADEQLKEHIVCAIPDPHIERWLLLDSAAFKKVVGKGCNAPNNKCDKDRYKNLLRNAIREAGVRPSLGGIELAEELANEFDIVRIVQLDKSFKKFIDELRAMLKKITPPRRK